MVRHRTLLGFAAILLLLIPATTGTSPAAAPRAPGNLELLTLDLLQVRQALDAGHWTVQTANGGFHVVVGGDELDDSAVVRKEVDATGAAATVTGLDVGVFKGKVGNRPDDTSIISITPKSLDAVLEVNACELRFFESLPGVVAKPAVGGSQAQSIAVVKTWSKVAGASPSACTKVSPPSTATGREACQAETPVEIQLAMDAHRRAVTAEGGTHEVFGRQAWLHATMEPAFTDPCVGVKWVLMEQWAGANWPYTDMFSALAELQKDWNTNPLHASTTSEITYGLVWGSGGGAADICSLNLRTDGYAVGDGNNGAWNEWFIMAHELGHSLCVNHTGKTDTATTCTPASPTPTNPIRPYDYLHTPGFQGDECRYLAYDDGNAAIIRECVEDKPNCA